jgi:hypothetical protein
MIADTDRPSVDTQIERHMIRNGQSGTDTLSPGGTGTAAKHPVQVIPRQSVGGVQ